MTGALRYWWSQEWAAVLEQGGPAATRAIQRGQALQRRGAVQDLAIESGRIRGRVREERGRLLDVEIRWDTPRGEAWDAVIRRLADEVRFSAALLDGELPQDLRVAAEELGLALIPELGALQLHCGCSDRDPICPHVAAVHQAAAAQLDRHPFQLFRLRGMAHTDLLRAIREERGEGQPELSVPGADLSLGLVAAQGDLESVPVHPAEVQDPSATFRRLGAPPGVRDGSAIAQLIDRAAAGAWRLAAGDGAEAADEELLLAELRAQRMATPSTLAAALGREVADVRAELDRLFADGVVMRTGAGAEARYRAVRRPVRHQQQQ